MEIKRTVDVISSDPPVLKWNVRLITDPSGLDILVYPPKNLLIFTLDSLKGT